jgi:hypothetical protein
MLRRNGRGDRPRASARTAPTVLCATTALMNACPALPSGELSDDRLDAVAGGRGIVRQGLVDQPRQLEPPAKKKRR